MLLLFSVLISGIGAIISVNEPFKDDLINVLPIMDMAIYAVTRDRGVTIERKLTLDSNKQLPQSLRIEFNAYGKKFDCSLELDGAPDTRTKITSMYKGEVVETITYSVYDNETHWASLTVFPDGLLRGAIRTAEDTFKIDPLALMKGQIRANTHERLQALPSSGMVISRESELPTSNTTSGDGNRRKMTQQTKYRYSLAPVGASSCDLSVSAVSQQDCLMAVNAVVPPTVRGRTTSLVGLQVGSATACGNKGWSQVPLGCSAQSGTWHAHFRTSGPSTCGSDSYRPVCQIGIGQDCPGSFDFAAKYAKPTSLRNCRRERGFCKVSCLHGRPGRTHAYLTCDKVGGRPSWLWTRDIGGTRRDVPGNCAPGPPGPTCKGRPDFDAKYAEGLDKIGQISARLFGWPRCGPINLGGCNREDGRPCRICCLYTPESVSLSCTKQGEWRWKGQCTPPSVIGLYEFDTPRAESDHLYARPSRWTKADSTILIAQGSESWGSVSSGSSSQFLGLQSAGAYIETVTAPGVKWLSLLVARRNPQSSADCKLRVTATAGVPGAKGWTRDIKDIGFTFRQQVINLPQYEGPLTLRLENVCPSGEDFTVFLDRLQLIEASKGGGGGSTGTGGGRLNPCPHMPDFAAMHAQDPGNCNRKGEPCSVRCLHPDFWMSHTGKIRSVNVTCTEKKWRWNGKCPRAPGKEIVRVSGRGMGGRCLEGKDLATKKHGVRCCTDNCERAKRKSPKWVETSAGRCRILECLGKATYPKAVALCSRLGGTLCSSRQMMHRLRQQKSGSTGCQLDKNYVWITDNCANGGRLTTQGADSLDTARQKKQVAAVVIAVVAVVLLLCVCVCRSRRTRARSNTKHCVELRDVDSGASDADSGASEAPPPPEAPPAEADFASFRGLPTSTQGSAVDIDIPSDTEVEVPEGLPEVSARAGIECTTATQPL